MSHLLDEDMLAAARGQGLTSDAKAHMAVCQLCQREVSAWRQLSQAAREADRVATGPVEAPGFDALLAMKLAPAKKAPWGWVRLSLAVVRSQVRLLPRSLGPFTLAGFVAAVTAALVTPDRAWGARLFSVMVVAFVLIGVLAAGSSRHDPRRELLYCLPVSPAAVFLARLTLVLTLDLIAAAAASALLALAGGAVGFGGLIVAWFGPSLLASAVAVVVAVAGRPWLATVTGAALWMLGSITTLSPSPGLHVGVGAVLDSVWTTNGWTVVAAVVLLALAVRLVARSAPPTSSQI